jgi:hypothetical protein
MTESRGVVGVRGRSAQSGPHWLDRSAAWTGAHGRDRSDARPGSVGDQLARPGDRLMGLSPYATNSI